MAEAAVGMDGGPDVDLTEFRLLCNAACQRYNIEFKNTEVVASILLDTINLIDGTAEQRAQAHAILNAHMENFQDIMDEQEELDERIAFGMSVPHKDTNDGNDNYEPVLSGRSPLVTDAVAAHVPHANVAAAATIQYNNLISFVTYLNGLTDQLIRNMVILNEELARICEGHAYVYNNILFFNPRTDVNIRDTSLFPKYSFNILCNQNSFLLPQLLVLGERGVGSILQFFVCNVFNRIFRDYVNQEVIQFKIFNPTETNKLWQVKICLFGNEFTFISIQIISMSLGFFTDDSIQNDANLALTTTQALCFSLYNKCLSKDFNCLCSLSELDIKLFRYILTVLDNVTVFTNFIRHFLNNISETQLNIKKQYFIMGLYNVASCSSYPDYTPETKAYELLFDRAPDGINLFNNSMCFIKALNQQTPRNTDNSSVFPEQIRFAMGGGKLYSIFHKKLQELCNLNEIQGEEPAIRDARITLAGILIPNVLVNILQENIKAAADADFGCFYPEEGIAAQGIGASSCMSICMLLQLSLKQLIDTLFEAAVARWGGSEIDIGNSCIGTPPTTLSSLRIVLKNIPRFYTLNPEQNAVLQPYGQYLGDIANIKATISPYDFVMKGSMKSYIVHIFEAVHSYRNTGIHHARFLDIADFLTRYCMVTQEGFSSPIKGILDIFYTLFIIENFANRTFVTQKINKELKRVAICAQILKLFYTELQLPQNDLTRQMRDMLERMIDYGFNLRYSLLNQEQFGEIMETYVNFVSTLCNIYLTNNVNYLYFSVAGVPNSTRLLTTIETSFMNLLQQCHDYVLQLPVFANTIAQYTRVIQALATMGPIRPETNEQTAQTTSDLYLNKLYASCRDSENKKNGIVAIMSAYQTYLWNKDKIDMITRDVRNDKCDYIRRQDPEGIIQHLVATPTVFNSLLQIIVPFANADVLGMATPIGEINADDILSSRIAVAADANAATLLNTFLVFSWFITSVFGVKTKSKPSKVISLGRTYLRLLIDSPPREPRPYLLFGLSINIPDAPAAVVAPVAAVAAAAIDRQIVTDIQNHTLVAIVRGNEEDRLCLAYSSERIFGMAVNKYIKMDIDMNVTAARVAVARTVGIDPQHYPALAAALAAGITPDQYREGIAAGITHEQYTAAANQIETQRLAIQQEAIQQALTDVQQVNETNTISFNRESLVFKQEIFSELITRFSHLPRGNQYIVNAARYMRPIMLQICVFIDGEQPVNIREYMNSIREPPYPYRPALHDISKFTMLSPDMKNVWLGYLINKIFVVGGEDYQTIFDNMKLFVLLYNYIGPLNPEMVFPNPPRNINYLTAIGPLIDEHFKVCDIGTRRNREEAVEEVEVPAAPGIARVPPAILRGRRSAPRVPGVPGVPAAIRAANVIVNQVEGQTKKRAKTQGGGTRNNHTRRNKNKRKKNSNTKTKFKPKSSPKYKKVIPSSRSGSQSNRKKSKPKKSQKNVTFKRRRARK